MLIFKGNLGRQLAGNAGPTNEQVRANLSGFMAFLSYSRRVIIIYLSIGPLSVHFGTNAGDGIRSMAVPSYLLISNNMGGD